MRIQWLSSIVVLSFLVAACGVWDRRDTPVQSNGPDRNAGGVVEGVQGHVTSVDGNPVGDALVTPRSLDVPSNPIPELAVVTRRDGQYAWTLAPGHYEITVSAAGYRPSTRRVTVPKAQVATVDFTLERVQ